MTLLPYSCDIHTLTRKRITGDSVSAGQIIGAVGTTAAAESGQPHLHFAVTKDGKAVDPNEYLSG